MYYVQFRWNMSTEKRTTNTQYIELYVKQAMIRNSANRKPLTVFFNSNSGTTIAEAVNVQHSSIFGICEDVRYFVQLYYHGIINSHNGQLTLHTDLHASYFGSVRLEGSTIIGAKSKLLYNEIVKFQI